MEEQKPKSQSLAAPSSTAHLKELRKLSEGLESEKPKATESLEKFYKKTEPNNNLEKRDYKAQLASFLKEDFSPPPSLQGTSSKERAQSHHIAEVSVKNDKETRKQNSGSRKEEVERLKNKEKAPKNKNNNEERAKNLDLPLKKNEVKRLYEDYGDLKVLNDENSDDQLDENSAKGPNLRKEMGLGATWRKDALVQKINKENLLEYLNDLEIKMPNAKEINELESGGNIREEDELLLNE